MNENLKLILLGLAAMLITVLVFIAIEAVLIRPAIVSAIPNTLPPSITPSPSMTNTAPTQISEAPATPALLLTLSGNPFAGTPTLMSPVGLVETAVNSPSPASPDVPGKTEEPQLTPTIGGIQPTQSVTPSNLPLGSAGIRGRVIFNGSTVNGTIVLKLVDQVSNETQQFTFTGGEYDLQDLQSSAKGYQIIFALQDNPNFSQDQVTSQVLLGPLPAGDGEVVVYPDLEIALHGLEPLEPSPDAYLSDRPISPEQPLRFRWSQYASLSQYRVEVKPNRLSSAVWVSGYVNSDSVIFDGVLSNGALIQPGTYWWSVSARSADGVITVIGPVVEFTLDW